MAIRHRVEVAGDLLLVTASGYDESLAEVQAYGLAVIEAALAHGCRRVLCDERQLEYRLGTVDTYQAAAFLAEQAPALGRAALVCAPECAPDAAFWETVAVNRGLQVRAFQSLTDAQAWIAEA
ncbi:MAG: hypothetical protein IT204_06945 [Fimbriimonadaceae bacterium]|nr:hypothetical protein [Fimbriimonadaceae bacterium]